MSFAARTHCWLLLLFPSRTLNLFCRSAFSPVSLILSCFLAVSQPGGRALRLLLLSFGRLVLDHFSSCMALCPPACCPLSCLVTAVSLLGAHCVPLSRSLVKTGNCIGPAIDPWGTTLGLWAADHYSSILTVLAIFHPPCSPFKNHVLVQVL